MMDKNTQGNGSKSNGAQQGQESKAHPLAQYSLAPQQQGGGEEDSPYYKSQAPSISLPKGGGALKGIDEKFSVNAVNGTAGLEITLPLTPGRGGFTPALSLIYSSGSGNGLFGQGWGLGLPSITRKTDKRLPRYFDAEESDVFLLAGAEDLVPQMKANGSPDIITTATYTIKRYRPRIEGLFAHIEHIWIKNTRESWWRVTTKDNITTWYGLDASSRIADPEDAGRIFSWLPVLVMDHKGNVQQYQYVQENTANVIPSVFEQYRLNGTAKFTNTYLKNVYYGNTTPYFLDPDGDVFAPTLPSTDWMLEAVLDYGDHSEYAYMPDGDWHYRSDAFSDYRAGFELRTYRRCQRVLMFHRFPELNSGLPTLVRSLELTYHNDTVEESPETPTETDYITKAVQRGYKWSYNEVAEAWEVQQKALPALELEYIPLQWDTTIHKVAKDDFRGAPQGLTGPYQWTDFEGEGISGILTEQAGSWYYKNNLGEGHFAPPRTIARKPNAQGLGQAMQWQDLDADGSRQAVLQSGSLKGYWELSPIKEVYPSEGKWQPFRTFEKNINIDWNSPFTLRLDLDGDGRADTLIAEDTVWTWYANKGRKGHDTGGKASLFRDEDKGPVLVLRDTIQSIFMADMSGDGLTDLVRIRNGEVCYWPNLGYGRFGAKITMLHAPLFQTPDIYNPLYLTLADISGTGAADLIYTGTNKLMAWINKAGNAFGEGILINPLPATDAYSKISIVDFLGNGTGCVVWSSPLPQHSTAPLQYIDLMGGKKPYLLDTYSNGMGKEIKLEYKSSTHYYLEDKKQGIRWATKLPFPVHCVHQVHTFDAVSETTYTQTYRYRHGYYDSPEREFRGFGYVETLDLESAVVNGGDLDQPPVMTKTWYHTGAWMQGEQLLDAYNKEYFRFEGWDDFVKVVNLPQDLNWQENREAYRALKGSALRQEVYALDGTDKASIPYTITATAYKILKLQDLSAGIPKETGGLPPFAVFMNLKEQSVIFSCERDVADPRIAHELVLETDAYGHVLKSAQVAYRRKETHIDPALPDVVQLEQLKTHITCKQNNYTNDVIDDDNLYYRLRLPFRERNYELHPEAASPVSHLYTVAELLDAMDDAVEVDFSAVPLAGEKRLLSYNFSLFYNDAATAVLEPGELESLAIPYESYTLAYTEGILLQCYNDADPELIRVDDNMIKAAGYHDVHEDGNYWLPSGTTVFNSPETNFYTPIRFKDPWGNETTITFNDDSNWMLPESTIDAVGNVMQVLTYDWNSLQATTIRDINDNVSHIAYDALGMPVAMAIQGKAAPAPQEGDSLAALHPDDSADLILQAAFWADPESASADLLKEATWRCVYDLNSTPVAVAMIGRTQHTYPVALSSVETLLQFTYTDGLGRVIMQKAQCQPISSNDNKGWIGSGRTIYNNKGNPVMQYEPYFSSTHYCDTAEQAAQQGVSPKLYYDALGRNYRTDLPDGTFTKTEWTAWEQQIWDNNDTVLDSAWYTARIGGAMGAEEEDAAEKAAAHANTPIIIHTDTLARGFYTLQNDGINPIIHSYELLDITGDRLAVVDGRGLTPLTYRYNMLQAPCYQQSLDSGSGRTLLDVAGQPLYAWDALDLQTEMEYDVLRRPLKRITDGKILERNIYGETRINPKELNYRGQVYQSYDGSGRQQVNGYDIKGNPLATQILLLENPELTDADWSVLDDTDLSTEVFISSGTFDALNRPVTTTDPGGNIQSYTYGKGGALKTVELNAQVYVQDIHYDAKGQRQTIWYGNGTKTSYTYDEFTFRLRRLLTVNLHNNEILQDLNYWYDPVGNITELQDHAQQTIFFNNSVVSPTQAFIYDALYQLIEASGRELIGTATFGATDNWNDVAWQTTHKGNGNAVQNYTQKYTYDAVGNILELRHIADAGAYTRIYDIETDSNRLLSTYVDPDTYSYSYDIRGNMTEMPHLDAMHWNLNNELHQIANGTMEAYYQYSGGQRIRKYVDKGSINEERIYLGSYEIYRKFDHTSSLIIERQTVHVSDDTGRIAMLETRTHGSAGDDNNTAQDLIRYIYSNHLQSASLELDEAGEIISYEEYHPYGTTSYQAMNASINAVAKRYRYTGKERDEESGLYYHGARYYIPWLCRWTAVDPLESKYAGMSPYNYGFNNPVIFNDPSGEDGEDVVNNPEAKKDENGEIISYKGNPVKNRTNKDGSIDILGLEGENYIVIETILAEVDIHGSNTYDSATVDLYSSSVPVVDYNSFTYELRHRDFMVRYGNDQIESARKQHQIDDLNKMFREGLLDQPYIGQDKNGDVYSVTQRQINAQGFMNLEAIRTNTFAAYGYLLGGEAGIRKGAMIGDMVTAYAGYKSIQVPTPVVYRDFQNNSLVLNNRVLAAKTGYSATSNAVRSALSDRIGKRGFSEVGYQFQKHFGRGGNWSSAISEGVKLNPTTFNQAGYNTFKEIWRAPGSFKKVGGFLEKRLPDGRGIRLQENWQFKGFLD